MVAGGGGNGKIPAGYTYLGQFVDHDLTMDRTDADAHGEDVSPPRWSRAGLRGWTWTRCTAPAPATRESAKFYEADGLHLKVGTTIPAEGVKAKPRHDLPRVGKGGLTASQKALIPDPRNDENLIVAQTHLAMINFHNKVVDKIPASLPPAQRFARARKRVTLHYQWMLRHDYLPRICAALGGQRRVQQGPQAGRARRRADRHTDDADRVLGRGVPARATAWSAPTTTGTPTSPATAGCLDWMFIFSALGRRPRR